MTVADLLFQSLGFHVGDDVTGDLKAFCEALAAPLEDVHELVREGDDGSAGWSLALDADNCPASVLPWLAQFVGVVITDEMSESQIRNEIAQPAGWARGRDLAIVTAVQRTLTGSQLLIIYPNKPEVGKHYVRSLLSETPNPTATQAIARAVIPAWSVLEYEAIEGVTVADVAASAKWTTVADLAAAFSTVQKLTEILPTDL